MFFTCVSDVGAQMFGIQKTPPPKADKTDFDAKAENHFITEDIVGKEVLPSKDDADNAEKENAALEDDSKYALLQEEQKALERAIIIDEIKFSGKKSIHDQVNKQTIDERKEFVNILKSVERKNIRNEMLSKGFSEDEIARKLEKINEEHINFADSAEVQTYLFKKSGLLENE